ncbi:MAG: alkaline phosphatase family protein, partial [Desulfobacteraceae bacterium]
FENEDRCLVPSPRDVPTYDYKPQMSALAVTDEVLQRIASDHYDLIVLNFANMDMVGHTGKLEAAIEAVQTVDQCVGRIVDAVLAKRGAVLITADHGNAETIIDDNGHVHTAHTTNPVHLVLVDDAHEQLRLRPGVLGDVAPTILDLGWTCSIRWWQNRRNSKLFRSQKLSPGATTGSGEDDLKPGWIKCDFIFARALAICRPHPAHSACRSWPAS